MTAWGTPIEIETRRRIRLAVWAYAYEFENKSLVSDQVFDVESYCVDVRIDTGNPMMDYWFRGFFEPATGLWIHQHPEIDKIRELYERHYK